MWIGKSIKMPFRKLDELMDHNIVYLNQPSKKKRVYSILGHERHNNVSKRVFLTYGNIHRKLLS